MIQPYTVFNVADNSGAKKALVISVLKSRRAQGRIGDCVVVSVKVAIPGGNAKTHEVAKGVIVRTKQPHLRSDGTTLRFDDNAIVLVNDDNTPRATRIFGPVTRELRERYPKIISLAPEVL